jgi:hypothetical protein
MSRLKSNPRPRVHQADSLTLTLRLIGRFRGGRLAPCSSSSHDFNIGGREPTHLSLLALSLRVNRKQKRYLIKGIAKSGSIVLLFYYLYSVPR